MILTTFEKTLAMVYTLGETLVDILFDRGGSLHATPGGAMLNTAVSLARKKVKVSLISELGKDKAGDIIIAFLKQNGVEVKNITRYTGEKTSLALAFLDEKGKPVYSFYKSYPDKRVLNTAVSFTANDYLLFGSLYSLDPAVRPAIKRVLSAAVRAGAVVVYDPNIRNRHHLHNPSMMAALTENIQRAHVVKGSDEDFINIFGNGTPRRWFEEVRRINPEACVVITLGEKGAVAFCYERFYDVKAVKTKVVSTVGAGDAFSAGLLKAFPLHASRWRTRTDWQQALEVAAHFAASACASEENYVSL